MAWQAGSFWDVECGYVSGFLDVWLGRFFLGDMECGCVSGFPDEWRGGFLGEI